MNRLRGIFGVYAGEDVNCTMTNGKSLPKESKIVEPKKKNTEFFILKN